MLSLDVEKHCWKAHNGNNQSQKSNCDSSHEKKARLGDAGALCLDSFRNYTSRAHFLKFLEEENPCTEQTINIGGPLSNKLAGEHERFTIDFDSLASLH